MRIGIYGGSFDPIHLGHLWVAEEAHEWLKLDQVWFLPAAQNPLKQSQEPSDDKHRLEMIRLAIAGVEYFRLDQREVLRGGISFTIDTLREIRWECPSASLFLMMGSDALKDFGKWKEPEEICKLAVPSVFARGGDAAIDWSSIRPFCSSSRLEAIQQASVETSMIQLSSTELRSRIAAGRSIRFRVPRAVEMYIRQHELYAVRG